MSHKRGPHNAACNENKNQLVLNFMLTKKGFVDFARNPKHKFHVGLCYIYHLSFYGIENQNVFLRFICSVGLEIILNWVFDIIKKQFNFKIWQCPIYTKYCFLKYCMNTQQHLLELIKICTIYFLDKSWNNMKHENVYHHLLLILNIMCWFVPTRSKICKKLFVLTAPKMYHITFVIVICV